MTPTRRIMYEQLMATIERERPEHDQSDFYDSGDMLRQFIHQDLESNPVLAAKAARAMLEATKCKST